MATKIYRRSIDADQLRAVLDYNPYTGTFRWRYRPEMRNAWNMRYTGQVAGRSVRGYVIITLNNLGYKAHRLAWLYMTNSWPAVIIDHIDGNGLNNIFANLREATHSQNTANASKVWGHNTSGFRGVYWNERRQKWQARIEHGGRQRYIGQFATAIEAHQAYLRAAVAINGHFVRQTPIPPQAPVQES